MLSHNENFVNKHCLLNGRDIIIFKMAPIIKKMNLFSVSNEVITRYELTDS